MNVDTKLRTTNTEVKEKSMSENLMDDANKTAIDVLATKGIDAAIKYMFKDEKTGRPLSYGEMRARYG